MSLHGLTKWFNTSSMGDFLERSRESFDVSATAGLRATIIAAGIEESQKHGDGGVHLIITATSREADRLGAELSSLIENVRVEELAAWETLPHERLSPATETVGKRQKVFAGFKNPEDFTETRVVVASVRAVLQPISQHAAAASALKIFAGSDASGYEKILQTLAEFGYTRVDMVTRRGEFAARGGMIDVFVPTEDFAVRIDFFGDEIDEMRFFHVADQRSAGEPLKSLNITIARELLITEEVRQRAASLRGKIAGFDEMLAKISEGIEVPGMEVLLPVLTDDMKLLTELLPAGGSVTVIEPERVATRAASLRETNEEFLVAAWEQAGNLEEIPAELSGDGLASLNDVRAASKDRPWRTISSFQSAPELSQDEVVFYTKVLPAASLGASPSDFYTGKIKEWLASGMRVVVALPSPGLAQRAAETLLSTELPVASVQDLEDQTPGLKVTTATVTEGFFDEEAGIVLLNGAEFFGRQVADRGGSQKKLARRAAAVVDPLKLNRGDYVVHEVHGVGQFLELTQRMVPTGFGREKAKREYLVLEYASSKRGLPKDKLFVPTDQLDQLSRYVGGEAPALSKMGGSDWANTKKKARKAVRDIAVELVKLYASRAQAKGHAFGPDTPWQQELEEAFPYVETVDQLTTIAEVKSDMEKPRPMDRLISGDVGFGKTEIAVRAAFKAVQDNKQVAILVPTTLLVKQHMDTFADRFAGFPVRLKALSRFQTEKEARETIEQLAAGTVDVVIGTHRLLAEKVQYKDIGLLIIDEEQRFGVEHKDSLKKLKTGVDVLAMSATPIPRTLEMAVTGIREMSTLQTAPEDRHPILTFVGPKSDGQMAAAIRREMLREGQVFVVHNRVQSITRVAAKIAELVPEARVAVAHGRLSETQLEQVVIDFWERKYDVLVSTTIIETGLDIANANTIIIDQADRYGLSQLHQLRGRVGRSRERAYAYFFFDADKPLTETANERLETIARNNELGSGMQVALKDLELRGAGNLLGGEQSGHIAGVGFDLYLRMIQEAVQTFKGEETVQDLDLKLELPIDAHIPESYIESERLRLEAYQKFAAAAHPNAKEETMGLVLEELRDRYGEPPAEVELLARVSQLRRQVAKLGISKFVAASGTLRVEPVTLIDSRQMRLKRMYPRARYTQSMNSLTVALPSDTTDVIEWATAFTKNILQVEAPTNE